MYIWFVATLIASLGYSCQGSDVARFRVNGGLDKADTIGFDEYMHDWQGNDHEFINLEILANATRNSYTGKDQPVNGYELVFKVIPQDGLHAFVYRRKFTNKYLVAYRGTTSESDKCADAVLFKGEFPKDPDANCSRFSNNTLDYFSQATNVVDRVLGLETKSRIVFTGHSLGCSLSQLMMLKYSKGQRKIGSFCFSAVGVRPIAERYNISMHPKDHSVVFDLPYDPVFLLTKKQQLGKVCTFEGLNVPTGCKQCVEKTTLQSCSRCFEPGHIFYHYLSALHSLETDPGTTLTCKHYSQIRQIFSPQ